MNPSRVLLFAMPPLLNDVLEPLLTERPDEVVTFHGSTGEGLVAAVLRTHADVVITAAEEASAHAVCELLERWPRTRALAVSGDGCSGVLYELRPRRRVIDDLSVAELLAGIAERPPCAELLLSDPSPQSAP